jgi:hypothetical protein
MEVTDRRHRRGRLASAPLAGSLVLGFMLSFIGTAPGAHAASPVEEFSLLPGVPARNGDNFSVPEFVLDEPAGGAANASETEQAWQSLRAEYVGPGGGPFENWSVTDWGPGWFTLLVTLGGQQVAMIEGGQAILVLNASVQVDGQVLGASGTIGSATLLSATVPSGWWTTWFGIDSPPPSADASLQGVLDWLAWWGGSTAGRASYAAATLIAIGLYLWEGHKLARRALAGGPNRTREAT